MQRRGKTLKTTMLNILRLACKNFKAGEMAHSLIIHCQCQHMKTVYQRITVQVSSQ